MLNSKKNLLLVAGLALALSACGKGDDKGQSSGAAAVATGPSTTQFPGQQFNQIVAENGGYVVWYRFEQNGCRTGYKEISSWSEAQTREYLCSALQHNGFNRYCAADVRQAYFNMMCPGKTWTPTDGGFW